jgi:uncharacterized RDD family membrane protein YckC
MTKSSKVEKLEHVDIKEAVFAGVWIRFVAQFIDGLILSPLVLPVMIITLKSTLKMLKEATPGVKPEVVFSSADKKTIALFTAVSLVFGVTYSVLLNSSKWQGTVGKKLLGLKITDLQGARIDRATAFKRLLGQNGISYVGNLLSLGNPSAPAAQMVGNIAGIYYLVNAVIGGADAKKQTIHDKFAGTYVVTSK